MDFLLPAFEKSWFYAAAVIIGLMYGFGGLVHIGNILGFGEIPWSEAPLSWRVGDIVWGILDLVAVIGILIKAPIGLFAVVLAAISQILVYGVWPEHFVLHDEHYAILKGMIYFNGAVLAVLALLVWYATSRAGT